MFIPNRCTTSLTNVANEVSCIQGDKPGGQMTMFLEEMEVGQIVKLRGPYGHVSVSFLFVIFFFFLFLFFFFFS